MGSLWSLFNKNSFKSFLKNQKFQIIVLVIYFIGAWLVMYYINTWFSLYILYKTIQ